MEINKVYNGNNLEILKQYPDNFFDNIITDPPYGLGFMNKDWDKPNKTSESNSTIKKTSHLQDMIVFQNWFEEEAKEFIRILKPGGFLLAFGGTKTFHRTVCAIENAGFEIRDMIEWIYSGFTKNLNIKKAIDKIKNTETENNITLKELENWMGWGTALKPAHEPICVARKPLEKGLNVIQNMLKWGTGGINIDDCRIEFQEGEHKWKYPNGPGGMYSKKYQQYEISKKWNNWSTITDNEPKEANDKGRFPSNLIHDGNEEIIKLFPQQKNSNISTASFFYCAKASKVERNKGCEFLKKDNNDNVKSNGDHNNLNNHPTVKPIKLMQYLIRLVCRKGGIVLDPFGGSGTTGIACVLEGMNYVLIEQNKEYCEIAEARIKAYQEGKEKYNNKIL